jgi:ADP-ribose pyrophosphatase YjhB (NUDIX family)
MAERFRCVIHGSFSKHFDEINKTRRIFEEAGIEVLAPKPGSLTSATDSFGLFEDEQGQDPRLVELKYLHNLKILGPNGFSYFVDPEGYIGKSASYELGIAQLTNTRCYFSHMVADHPAYIHSSNVISPEALADYVYGYKSLPNPKVRKNEILINKLWHELMVPGSVVAAGAIIEYQPKKTSSQKEILLVKTHKWGDRYSIVGGKVKQNETIVNALRREVMEETRLFGEVGNHIATFDEIKDSGYYRPEVQHIFIDKIYKVFNKKVTLNDEAQDYLWATPNEALRHIDIEPNARQTLELYFKATRANHLSNV